MAVRSAESRLSTPVRDARSLMRRSSGCRRAAIVLGADVHACRRAAILLVFLAYPLGLGFWLGMTDTTIGEAGRFIGFANFVSLAQDPVFWLSVFNTMLYTVVASILKFALRPLPRAAAQPAGCRSSR